MLHLHLHLSFDPAGRWGITDDSQPVFSIFFLVLHCPLGLAELQPCPVFDVVSHLFFCLPCLLPLSLCLARWFWPDLMNGRLVYLSLRLFTMVRRSSCHSIACWILARTSSLVTGSSSPTVRNSVFLISAFSVNSTSFFPNHFQT